MSGMTGEPAALRTGGRLLRMPSSGSRGLLSNGLWNAGQQGLTLALNALFVLLLIRYVPVDLYGVYSYALALCAIGNAIMSAGLTSTSVKALTEDRPGNASIVTGLLVLREAFAVLGYVVIGAVSLTSGDRLAVVATLLAGIALIGRASEAPEAWFISHLRTAQTARIRVTVSACLFVLRLALLYIHPSIWVFLSIFVAESVLTGGLVLARYLRDPESPRLGRLRARRLTGLTKVSWPLMLSVVAQQINLRADVVIVQAVLGATALGVYSAATRISELLYFLPTAFMASTLPALLSVRASNGPTGREYQKMLQRSYDQAFWVGVLAATALAVVGTVAIKVLFGPEYALAVTVLLIHVSACPFVFMAAVYAKWMIAEGLLWSPLLRHAAGAAVNVVLNLLFVQRGGIVFAAVATLVSYVCASYLASFLGRRSRPAARQMTLAILAPLRLALHGHRRLRAAKQRPAVDIPAASASGRERNASISALQGDTGAGEHRTTAGKD
jgi:O-antigen/teichoic acid export membrane protein